MPENINNQTRPQSEDSGWEESSDHNSNVFESIVLDDKLEEKFTLYDQRAQRQAVLSVDSTFPYSLFKPRVKR